MCGKAFFRDYSICKSCPKGSEVVSTSLLSSRSSVTTSPGVLFVFFIISVVTLSSVWASQIKPHSCSPVKSLKPRSGCSQNSHEFFSLRWENIFVKLQVNVVLAILHGIGDVNKISILISGLMQYCNESWSWLGEKEGVASVRWLSLGRRGFGFGNDLMGLMFGLRSLLCVENSHRTVHVDF
jgi:hypothetical protein